MTINDDPKKMQWWEHVAGKENLEVWIFGPDKLMRINFEDSREKSEMVVDLRDYRILSFTTYSRTWG